MEPNQPRSGAGIDWARLLDALGTYKDEHGNLLVPQRYETADGYSLARQVNRLRDRWDLLPAERRAQLVDLGFIADGRTGL